MNFVWYKVKFLNIDLGKTVNIHKLEKIELTFSFEAGWQIRF